MITAQPVTLPAIVAITNPMVVVFWTSVQAQKPNVQIRVLKVENRLALIMNGATQKPVQAATRATAIILIAACA